MNYRLTIYVIIMSMSEQVKQTTALYNYINESPYLSQSQAEKRENMPGSASGLFR